ncbi:hypothetical protein [Comamonas sp. CMM02]|uniref:hypothetical protein n=1 Tax=Comamonas sp. CMM02 TaxID=2769307 RepID=UPI0017865D56|nr:hypothetical protein [Comamonas sp. CMM02]MBD9400834.1 hypothetical protein [Comamonas sp. CMM02]
MKRLEASQSRQFSPLVLRLDGLREILTVLAPAEGVKIVADGMEYESVDELAGHLFGKSPRELKVTGSSPYLTVELSPFSARLYAGSDDLVSSGMFARIAAVLSAAERSPRALYKNSWVFLLMVGLQVLSIVPALKSMQQGFIGLFGLTIAWYLWINFIHLRKHGLLLTHEPKDGRSFYQRNADSIVVAVVSAILGAVLGAAATKLADRIIPTTQAATVLHTPATPHRA